MASQITLLFFIISLRSFLATALLIRPEQLENNVTIYNDVKTENNISAVFDFHQTQNIRKRVNKISGHRFLSGRMYEWQRTESHLKISFPRDPDIIRRSLLKTWYEMAVERNSMPNLRHGEHLSKRISFHTEDEQVPFMLLIHEITFHERYQHYHGENLKNLINDYVRVVVPIQSGGIVYDDIELHLNEYDARLRRLGPPIVTCYITMFGVFLSGNVLAPEGIIQTNLPPLDTAEFYQLPDDDLRWDNR